jgi:tryptophan-rich sensory protein
MGKSMQQWYPSLIKPSFTPPGWLFPIVWPVLYFMMAVAAFLIARKGLNRKPVQIALVIFAFQLLLNALWSPIFFTLHLIGLAAIEIIFLWAGILATIIYFWRISRFASLLLWPYLAWVSFAAVLNFSIWYLNRTA